MVDLREISRVGDQETTLLPETRGITRQLEIRGASLMGLSLDNLRLDIKALRQLPHNVTAGVNRGPSRPRNLYPRQDPRSDIGTALATQEKIH